MPQTTKAAQLAQTIRSNLLGVLPMDQDTQLEDADWRLILDALEPKGTSAPVAPRAFGFSRTWREQPDGTFKMRTRRMFVEPDLSTPEPSCDAPSCDCAEGEDCRANVAEEARRAADRVMIRAVRRQLGDGHRDDDGNAVWVIDRMATAHLSPFSPGDIIIDPSGSSGFREVLEVQPHPDVERLIRLVVRRVDGLVFDADEF